LESRRVPIDVFVVVVVFVVEPQLDLLGVPGACCCCCCQTKW
jgi:hypothetical protein